MTEINDLDKNLYKKYKEQILLAMQGTDFNLSRELTALLGPPQNEWNRDNGPNGLIERMAHTSADNATNDDIKGAISRLNDLLKTDPWLSSLSFKTDDLKKDNINQNYKSKFILHKDYLKTIFPKSNNLNIEINNDDRLHILPTIFYKKNNGKTEWRLMSLLEEIKNNNAPANIAVKGFNEGNGWECLYVLSLEYTPSTEKEWGKSAGKLIFPDSLKKWYFDYYLNRYCDYYIVVNNSYCNVGKDKEFSNCNCKMAMTRSGKAYEYSQNGDNAIKHILIFDNYQKKYEKGTGGIPSADEAGG